jgi:hypothetical protein
MKSWKAPRPAERGQALEPGACSLPARQRGLRAALDYTLSVLDEESRELFAGLGAFADVWTIEDAERLFGAELDLWEAMATLLDLSLIRTRGDGRLTMAERVKTHARELLAQSGREAELRGRHAKLMAETAEAIDLTQMLDYSGYVARTRGDPRRARICDQLEPRESSRSVPAPARRLPAPALVDGSAAGARRRHRTAL